MLVRHFREAKSPEEYLRLAYEAAQDSPDPSTQNGAIVVIRTGPLENPGIDVVGSCNTFPDGVRNLPERLVRPIKYNFIEHAERNAIFACWRHNHDPAGCTMYCPWFACSDCARAIIQAGISKVVGHKRMFDVTPDHWKESIAFAFQMLDEAGVKRELIDGPIPNAPKVRFNGKEWQP